MKKILQDLSYAELEALVLALGEKKFRAKQLYEGLMQGKSILAISSLSKAFKERLLEEYENEPVRIKETFLSCFFNVKEGIGPLFVINVLIVLITVASVIVLLWKEKRRTAEYYQGRCSSPSQLENGKQDHHRLFHPYE